MGGIADFIGDVVGGAFDIVGDVVEGVVDIAGDVIEVVSENPLLLAAAIATPYALGAMAKTAIAKTAVAGTASAGAGVSASSMGLIGPTLMGAAGATPAALSSAALAAKAGAGVLGAGATAGGLTILPSATYLGGIAKSAGGLMTDPFTFPSMTEATNYGKSILNATNQPTAAWNASQTGASNVLGSNPAQTFFSQNLDPTVITQAKDAVFKINNGMPYNEAVTAATGGTAKVPSSWDMFTSNVKEFGKTIDTFSSNAERLVNQIGQTIAPGADPLVQKAISTTAVETVQNGGNLQEAIESTLVGMGTGFVGSEITNLSGDVLGSTGARMAGRAAANATGTALTGGDVTQSLIGSGIGALGSGVTDLTGNRLIGGAASNVAGSLASGRDVGTSLLGYGINAGVEEGMDLASNVLGLDKIRPRSVLGRITNAGTSGLSSIIKQSAMSGLAPNKSRLSPLSSASAQRLLQRPTTAVRTPSAPQQVVRPTLPAGTNMPARRVDVATLTPISNIEGLTGTVIK